MKGVTAPFESHFFFVTLELPTWGFTVCAAVPCHLWLFCSTPPCPLLHTPCPHYQPPFNLPLPTTAPSPAHTLCRLPSPLLTPHIPHSWQSASTYCWPHPTCLVRSLLTSALGLTRPWRSLSERCWQQRCAQGFFKSHFPRWKEPVLLPRSTAWLWERCWMCLGGFLVLV